MARVKTGSNRRRRHKKIIKMAKTPYEINEEIIEILVIAHGSRLLKI